MTTTTQSAVTAIAIMTATTGTLSTASARVMTFAAEYAVSASGIMTTVDTSTVSTATAYGKLAGMTNVMTTRRSTVSDMERCATMQAGVVWCRMMQTDKVMIK